MKATEQYFLGVLYKLFLYCTKRLEYFSILELDQLIPNTPFTLFYSNVLKEAV